MCPECTKATGLICDACGALLPPRPIDKFAAMGLPRRYAVELPALEARYRELQRKLHPDRFARAEPEKRLWSVQATTTLNQAFRALRDPVARAEELLVLAGESLDDKAAVTQGFLMEMMELNEAREDARAAGDEIAMAQLRADVSARRARALAAIGDAFAKASPNYSVIKAELVALRYFDRFLADATAKVEARL